MTGKMKVGSGVDNRPMVSVVMITYNQERYVEKAIRGVLRQKGGYGLQLVICDDASTDGTPAIAEKWQREYPDIIDFHRNPHNIGLARNYVQALSLCRGKYVAMCDGDDYWCSRSKLKLQVGYMENHPDCALTYHRVINYYQGTGEKHLSNGGGASSQSVTAGQLAKRNSITNLSVMYRAELVDLKKLPEWLAEIRLVDYCLHLLYASKGGVHYFSKPMGVYRKAGEGVWTHAESVQRLRMAFDVRVKMIRELQQYPEIVAAIRESCVDHIVSMLAEGERGLAEHSLHLIGAGSSITVESLEERVSARRRAIAGKKNIPARIAGFLSRLLPLPS